jgi:hypothetical protein
MGIGYLKVFHEAMRLLWLYGEGIANSQLAVRPFRPYTLSMSRPSPALRTWFVIHFWADILFAIPLFIAPESVLSLFGWQAVDPVAARSVSAALFAIGIESYLCRNAGTEVFKAMLNLKIIWSFAATLGLLIALVMGTHGRPLMLWLIFLTFVSFHVLWVYWRTRLAREG